jgi:hypothetical protein
VPGIERLPVGPVAHEKIVRVIIQIERFHHVLVDRHEALEIISRAVHSDAIGDLAVVGDDVDGREREIAQVIIVEREDSRRPSLREPAPGVRGEWLEPERAGGDVGGLSEDVLLLGWEAVVLTLSTREGQTREIAAEEVLHRIGQLVLQISEGTVRGHGGGPHIPRIDHAHVVALLQKRQGEVHAARSRAHDRHRLHPVPRQSPGSATGDPTDEV